MDLGFISLHRSLINWEWYDDANVKVLFIHLLLTVNWEDKVWHGINIKRGSIITSYSKLAKETKLSVKKVRNSLEKLKSTGELAIKTTNKYTLISVVNYNKFQDVNYKNGKQTDKQKANKGQQLNKYNKYNNYIYTPQKGFKNYSDREELTQDEKINITKLIKKYGGCNDRYKN